MPVATDLVARRGLEALVARPGVTRVGLALVEGGGRRLRFTASDRDGAVVDWCHVDAYADVPLTTVVRTGTEVRGPWGELEPMYAGFVAQQRATPAAGLVAAPLVAHGQVLGGVVVFVDDTGLGLDVDADVDAIARGLRQAQARAPRPDGLLGDAPVAAGAHVADCEVPGEPQAVGVARRFVRRQLADWGVDDDVSDTAVLCLSELVTNAVIHTGAPAEVRVLLEDGVLTVTVRDRGVDGGAASFGPGHDDPLRVHGRGLQLVGALAARWGSELDEVGTTVWFVLDA